MDVFVGDGCTTVDMGRRLDNRQFRQWPHGSVLSRHDNSSSLDTRAGYVRVAVTFALSAVGGLSER
jgi:hypothetical protein